MVIAHVSVVSFMYLLSAFHSSIGHLYYAVNDDLRATNPIFRRMGELALEQFTSPELLKVYYMKNAFDDHNKGRKYHVYFTAGPANCQKNCQPTVECDAHTLKSENNAIAIHEVNCRDVAPEQAQKEVGY